MSTMTYGYIRVSSKDQNELRQRIAMREAGIPETCLFVDKQADIVVLDMLLNTRRGRDLTGTLIANIVLQLLSYVAQAEREFIRQRQAEGIAAAKKNGVRFGRRPLERPAGYEGTYTAWESGELTVRAAARRLNISHQTFLR